MRLIDFFIDWLIRLDGLTGGRTGELMGIVFWLVIIGIFVLFGLVL